MAGWKTQDIQQLNGKAERITLPAKLQILTESWTGNWTESWNQVAAVPYITYIPEKDRVLMLVSCGYPHQAVILASDDHGATWSEPWYVHTDQPGKSDTGMAVGLAYVGRGKVLLWTCRYWLDRVEDRRWFRWSSDDYGQTWSQGSPMPLPGGMPWNPPMMDRDPKTGEVTRLWETAYMSRGVLPEEEDVHPRSRSRVYLRQSVDKGRTWTEWVKVPEWAGLNEIALIRARNGDMVAAGRTRIPDKFADGNDNYSGLVVSISEDDGRTWSKLNRLYEWGRHHQSLVLLPDGDIVMTYAARKGYVETPEGYPQFGVEAVVSHDNGRTWDLDHRYILAAWPGNRTDPAWSWTRCSQMTSSVLLPNGSILTVFGAGCRATVPEDDPQRYSPRDVGLVNWRVNNEGLNDDRTIADAPSDSDLRNRFDPLLEPL